MKAIVYTHQTPALERSNQEALDRGCTGTTAYWFPVRKLTETSEISKEEYASMQGISQTVTDGDGNEVENPEYTKLAKTHTVNKYAVVVGDALDTVDEEGNRVVPDEVEDVSDRLPVIEDEI